MTRRKRRNFPSTTTENGDGGTPGAMMTDARTPDGFYVGEDGAWIQ